MTRTSLVGAFLLSFAITACRSSGSEGTTSWHTGTTAGGGGSSGATSTGGGGTGGSSTTTGGGSGGEAGSGGGGAPCNGTPAECAAIWEQNASDKYDGLLAGPPEELAAFLAAVPKGGDLHNHLSGAVYAETYLAWAHSDGDCINQTTFAAVYSNQCSASNVAAPTSGTFYDSIVRAWSMKDFVAGSETGHDHFFAVFGKFGAVAGAHRNDDIADLATRAASENLLYVETMLNLGSHVGDLSASLWSGTLTAADLPGLYNSIVSAPSFANAVAQDLAVVTGANQQYRSVLGCSGGNPPAACNVAVRFMAQVSRTGAKDSIFGQLISAFEMAEQSPIIVAANLSSPEDDTTSINNYTLLMQMLDFLHTQYTVSGVSPLHISLHAGELTAAYLPQGSTANTFHIRQAVELGHAERIGHGLDIASETNSQGLLDEMRQSNVMVEICLSSNVQILEVSGSAHPLGLYMTNLVPVALATDDQGVSRSSLAGEYLRAATDQSLTYRQLKAMARTSLEHAFLPGDSLWISLADVQPASVCAATATMGLGDPPNPGCQGFLDGSERARMQWELEHRFRLFESQQ